MAKKKKAEARVRTKNIFVLRGSEDFQAWMAELAAHIGSPVTVMVERAMRELAKKEEFRGPPRRIP
jgi:hypothetical protein